MEGKSPASHLTIPSHCSTRCSGLVAHLTSVRPLPQAEEDTSHRKAKAAVTSRSWQGVHSVYIDINTQKDLSMQFPKFTSSFFVGVLSKHEKGKNMQRHSVCLYSNNTIIIS